MKKLVRLTESDLHRVIKESVNKVLTDLDWRTYANAAKKAREQGRDSRWDFDRATERALDKQYGGHHLVSTDNETYQDFHTYNDDPFSTNYDRAWRPLEGHEDFGSYADVHDNKKPYGNEDIADFVHGRSKYVKGKGWVTESDLHRIIKESVQKILNEADGWQTYDDTNMSPEEKAFRATISPNFNQSAIEYLGKLSNGNTLIEYNGVSFEITPKGKMIRVNR